MISYFMAGNVFTLQTYDGTTAPIGLSFDRHILSGGAATEVSPTQQSQGTTITIRIRDTDTFALLLDSFSHWCRDVEGLSGELLPDRRLLVQKGTHRLEEQLPVESPDWVKYAHLGPVSDLTGWDEMTGISTVAVLYRGVFVQEIEVKGAWGIEGSIDVDPKHFKPRLNREGFVKGQFETELTGFSSIVPPRCPGSHGGTTCRRRKKGDPKPVDPKAMGNSLAFGAEGSGLTRRPRKRGTPCFESFRLSS